VRLANGTIITIFHTKKHGEIQFQKQAAFLSFAQKKLRINMLMKLMPGLLGSFSVSFAGGV
jgi:hypothetical protein